MNNEVDKIANQLSSIASWLRAGKENENIRQEMYSAAEKTCREQLERISALLQDAADAR